MAHKFPMTRHEVAKQLSRPYSTITSWTRAKLVGEPLFNELKKVSDAAKRKTRQKKKTSKPKKPRRYYHPTSGSIVTEFDLTNGSDVEHGDTLYEVKGVFTYTENTTWELDPIDEKP